MSRNSWIPHQMRHEIQYSNIFSAVLSVMVILARSESQLSTTSINFVIDIQNIWSKKFC